MITTKTIESSLARARRHEDAGRYRSAHAIYDALLRADPSNPRLHARKGLAYYLANHPAQAVHWFDLALALHPRAPVTLEYRALAKELLGDLDGALRDHRRSIRQGEPDPDSYVNIGLIHEYRGKLSLARAAYRRAPSVAPDHELARNCLRAVQARRSGHPVQPNRVRSHRRQRPKRTAAP